MNNIAATVALTGDVCPFLDLGTALSERGHKLIIVTFPRFQALIEKYGLAFLPSSMGTKTW